MIFKKIYTFLNEYFNGKKISKVFSTLIFTLIVSSALFFSAYLADVSASSVEGLFDFSEINDEQESIDYEALELELRRDKQASSAKVQENMQSSPTVEHKSSGLSGVFTNEFYILYQKQGLPPNKIYTSYLPPKDTYNKDSDTEHSLDFCGSMGESGLKMIGRDCMIKIPFDCASPPDRNVEAKEGVNCLKYSNVFHNTSTGKKLNPKKCENGLDGSKIGDAKSCLSTEKNPCHETVNPILGINCKLAPCNSIPNQQYRRPGVNCLADCNDNPGKHISKSEFFMEGFNCLSSCKTFPSTPPKTIGQDCVLEFNKYVMPLCVNHPDGVTKHFNKANRQDRRENCLDVEDLPICVGASEQVNLKNCVNECNAVADPHHNKNCVNFNSAFKEQYYGSKNKTCHSYNDLDSLKADTDCKKYECHKLSDTELARSLNVFDSALKKSTAKYCFPSIYTKFSFAQFNAINSRSDPKPYLRDYLLDRKPCYTRGDTEEIETIVSSTFYDSSNSSKIDFLKNHAREAISQSSQDMQTTQTNTNFLYYDPQLVCPLDNVSQEITCDKYREFNHARPYDCNSASFCPDCSQQTICGKETDLYCFKNGINCNNAVNKIYPVCEEQVTSDAKPDKDEYVSWFFRPTVPKDALKKREGQGYYLVNMKGYPVTGGQNINEDLYMDIADMKSENYGEYFFGIDALWGVSRETTPPSNSLNFGIPGVGAGYLCGMNGNYRGIPDEEVGYFKGEVKTTYEADNKVTHEVEICLRYASGSAPDKSCGHRSCHTTCAFGICSKLCGIDVCRPLKITEGLDQNCKSNDYNFRNWNKAGCISTFETRLDLISKHTRVRIYKPEASSNYICAVLEFNGITTDMATRPFFKGDEYFEVPDQNDVTKTKKMCVSGNLVDSSQTCINGIDSNSEDSNSSLWRTSAKIKYIASPKEEYYDLYGVGPFNLFSNHLDFKTNKRVNQTIGRVKFNIKEYFETSDCIRHQQRVSAPPFPSVATPSNARRLFLPPIIIEKKCNIATPGNDCDDVDETDFFKPAITILYGQKDVSNSILSSDLNDPNTNYKIVKIQDPTSNVSGDYIIKAGNIGITEIDISQKVFARKESSGSQPLLCLYKKIAFGTRADQFKEELIECVNRKRATRATIDAPSSQVHTNLDFPVSFLKDEGDLHSSITTQFPTQLFQFSNMSDKINNNEYLKVCSEIPSQGFPICIKRDECSLLNNECVENEKSLILEKNSPTPRDGIIQQQEFVSNYCKKELLARCNLRKGYALTASNQTLNTSSAVGVGFNAPNHPNYHGWFNEFCIVSGIEKLDDPNSKIYVQRNINENEQLGSCIKDPNCSTCDNNRCLKTSCCKIIPNNDLLTFSTRSLATPHELGLCYELNVYLKSCPALSFGKNSNINDEFFIGDSFLSMNPPHSSHQGRFNSSILSYNSKHAEYEVAYAGTNALKGKCVGFYKNRIMENDPIANCDSNGNWQDFRDSCEMYSCPAKKLPTSNPGANSSGQYPSNYDSTNSPDGSKRGFSEGYANWNSFQKTTLLKQSASATSCIIGYAQREAINRVNAMNVGDFSSSALLSEVNSYRSTLSTEKNKIINSLYRKYTGFSGGIPPTRNCNQIGVWEDVTNSCERITCPPIIFDEPAEAGAFNMNDYDLTITQDGGKKIIYSDKSPWAPLDMPKKAKFTIASSLSATNINNPVYLSLTNRDNLSNNSFLIRGSSVIEINKVYVLEFRDSDPTNKFWQIIPNPNDDVLKILWNKSGGAKFEATGYALRSGKFDYEATDEGDKHKVIGECNKNMGFRSLLEEYKPQLTCDSNGNWIDLINPCVSDCGAISGDVARNAIHGFAIWEKSSATVGESKVEQSRLPGGGCVSGYYPYPYTPLFDNEGSKKDFGIGAVGINGASDKEFMTSDSYNAIAVATDGATFVATAGVDENLTPSVNNYDGIYYNLKIQTSNSKSQSQSVASSISQGSTQTLFYLFNSESSLNMSPPSQNVWSKINFSSFGTPEYFSEENIKEASSCSSPYSKLIFANKCIGKTSCSIGLSDFTSYDSTNTCTKTNPGNGLNGEQNNNVVDSFGSGGGGGGGNNPGNGGSPTGATNINGTSGSSFYDKSFHLSAPTLSDAGNKGLKVNLKVADNGQFKGKDGSVKIIESTTQDFRSIARTADYTSPGEQTHTVITGSVGQDIYIKYEMSGAGGGGGGQGLTQGTDGASGSKMTGGIFKVKHGTVLKIYVGGGGGAGKTKCALPLVSFLDPKITQPAIEIIEPTKKTNLAMLENYQLNPDQIIAQNTKIIDRDSSIKSPLAKIFSKISDIFISEGYAAFLTCANNVQTNDHPNGQFIYEETANTCANYDKTFNKYSCSCPILTPRGVTYGVRGFAQINYGNYDTNIDCKANTPSSGENTFASCILPSSWINRIRSFSFWNNTRVRFECSSGTWSNWIKFENLPIENNVPGIANLANIACGGSNLDMTIDQVQIDYYRKCSRAFVNKECRCNDNRYWNGTQCANITCTVPATANVLETQVNYATSATSLTCKTGYYSATAPTYTCSSSGGTASTTGSCTAINCTASGKGFADKTGLAYSNTGDLKTIACGGTGYLAYATGNINYTCSANGPATNIGTCACATGFARIGTSLDCTPIACTASGKGFADKTGLAYSNTGDLKTIACGGTGYLAYATGNINYTCSANGPATNIGTCACATGFARIGTSLDCTAIPCTISGTGYTNRDVSGVGEFACDEGYYGTINYTCTSAKTSTTPGTFTTLGSCTRIKCNLPEEAKSNIIPVANSNPQYREVDYAPLSAPRVYTCGFGYRKTFNSTTNREEDPTYTCVADTVRKQNPSTVAYQNPCVAITCSTLGGRDYDFSNGLEQRFDCDPNSGFWGQMRLRCNVSGQISWIERCNDIQCFIPENKNTTIDGQWVNYSVSMVEIDCKEGYYYASSSRPKYKCIYQDNQERRGILTFEGSCQRITCQIPATGSPFSLNSNIDGTSVNWISGYETTTCKEGFYQSSADSPSYSCSGSGQIGELRIKNACTPITCDLAESFGMLAKTNLEYGTNKTTSCNKLGYSGIVKYNCVNPVNAGKGVATKVSSTCVESSCFADDKILATFNAYVTPAGSSAVIAGGIGGRISSGIEFLKGGNGGSTTAITTTVSRTSASGGGGGSASMIAIDKRIIAIAGGGGGGAGGGGVENPFSALTKVSNVENLDIKLISNVFGPYFIGEMQYTPINIDTQKTVGILSGQVTSPSTQFTLEGIPPGTFINDIFFSSYGAPTIDFTNPESLVLKHGECYDQSSLTKSINQCVGKASCAFDTSTLFPSCQSFDSKKFGLVASYYFKEPTLQVVNSQGLPAYEIKEKLRNQAIPATNLNDGKVYTFILNKDENIWFKYPYKFDEYLIPEPFTSAKIRVRFHRTNTTFSPRLKTSQGSWQIFKSDESGNITSLSVGYIDVDKVYILTKNNGDSWIIREFTSLEVDSALPKDLRPLPKRSCMTTKISSAGAVNVSWSLPNSSCVNQCPGYDRVTGIGDDRIGVGATRHLTSNGEGIVYWKNGTIGFTSIMKFSNVKDSNNVFPETNEILTPRHFRKLEPGQTRQYFALARHCNEFGVWDPPQPLCVFHNSQPSDSDGIPLNPSTGNSYINFDQHVELTSRDNNEQKYLKVGSALVGSLCKAGYKQQTNDQFFNSATVYEQPKYNCVYDIGNKVDQVYFNQVDDPSRKKCVRYCNINNYQRPSSVSVSNVANREVRPNQDQLVNGSLSDGGIELECNSGYIKVNGVNPKAVCSEDSFGGLPWNIMYDCRRAADCYVSSLNKHQGKNNFDNNWFPLAKYITPEHRNAGSIPSGKVETFPVNKENYETQYGKCGYCTYQFEACVYNAFNGVTSCSKRGYQRKYLRSYSCNDGNWSAEWDYDDGNNRNDFFNGRPSPINRACDDDDWDWSDQNEEDHPNQLYLGSCEGDNSTNAFNNYNNLKNWP